MKTYTYPIRTNKEQLQKIERCLYLTRIMYNEALQEVIDHYKKTGKYLHRYEQDNLHNAAKHPELPAFVVDEVLNRVHKSFANFFRRCRKGGKPGFPRLKSEKQWRSFGMSAVCSLNLHGCRFHGGKKLGGKIRVDLYNTPPLGKQKIARFIKKASGWKLQIVTDSEVEKLEPTGKSVGIDVGITFLVADSDGHIVENPKLYKESQKKLRVAQRKVTRRKRGSNRRRKAVQSLARLHEKIANQRRDYLHKLSRYYIDRYDVIAIEDLKITSMVKNRHLSKSIMDSSWYMFRQLLEDKAAEAGRQVIAVNARNTSQICSSCGEIVKKDLSVRTHECPACGLVINRDINAAKNILNRAGVQPSGVNVVRCNTHALSEKLHGIIAVKG